MRVLGKEQSFVDDFREWDTWRSLLAQDFMLAEERTHDHVRALTWQKDVLRCHRKSLNIGSRKFGAKL